MSDLAKLVNNVTIETIINAKNRTLLDVLKANNGPCSFEKLINDYVKLTEEKENVSADVGSAIYFFYAYGIINIDEESLEVTLEIPELAEYPKEPISHLSPRSKSLQVQRVQTIIYLLSSQKTWKEIYTELSISKGSSIMSTLTDEEVGWVNKASRGFYEITDLGETAAKDIQLYLTTLKKYEIGSKEFKPMEGDLARKVDKEIKRVMRSL